VSAPSASTMAAQWIAVARVLGVIIHRSGTSLHTVNVTPFSDVPGSYSARGKGAKSGPEQVRKA
jgi:hypothetical protein